jgi:hypothetical protein
MKMNTLAVKMSLVMCATVVMAAVAFSAPTSVNADEYKARLQNLANTAQTQVLALEDKIAATTDETVKEDMEHQIMDLKRQSEIQRLQVLLEWAQASGDEARIADVQTALNNWLNPPQPRVMPQVDRDIPAPNSVPSTGNQR